MDTAVFSVPELSAAIFGHFGALEDVIGAVCSLRRTCTRFREALAPLAEPVRVAAGIAYNYTVADISIRTQFIRVGGSEKYFIKGITWRDCHFDGRMTIAHIWLDGKSTQRGNFGISTGLFVQINKMFGIPPENYQVLLQFDTDGAAGAASTTDLITSLEPLSCNLIRTANIYYDHYYYHAGGIHGANDNLGSSDWLRRMTRLTW